MDSPVESKYFEEEMSNNIPLQQKYFSRNDKSLLPLTANKQYYQLKVPLMPYQLQWYRSVLYKSMDKFELSPDLSRAQMLSMLFQLRKIVNHPKQIIMLREKEREVEKRRLYLVDHTSDEFTHISPQYVPAPMIGSKQWEREEMLRSLCGERLLLSSSKLYMLDIFSVFRYSRYLGRICEFPVWRYQ